MLRKLRPTRRGVVIGFITVLTASAAWIAISETEVPFVSVVLTQLTEDTSLLAVMGGLATVLVVAGIARLLSNNGGRVDRDRIVATPPETTVQKTVPVLYESQIAQRIDRASWFGENTTHSDRRYVMYGRRVESQEDGLPDDAKSIMNELAATARDVYATAESCSQREAIDAVRQGTWTTDRRAAAFLATTDSESLAGFTIRERVAAWVFPDAVFTARVEQVIAAIEGITTETYLTYEIEQTDDVTRPSRTTSGTAAGDFDE